MRKIHRWVMTVFAVLLLYVAASGILLDSYDYLDSSQAYAREGGGIGADTPRNVMGIDIAGAAPLSQAQLAPALKAALAIARQAVPDTPVASLEIHLEQGVPVTTVNMGMNQPRQIRVNAATGELMTVPSRSTAPVTTTNYHGVIKSWHRGARFGPIGATLVFLTGCAFLTLCMTGIVMYFTLWRARRRAGRPQLFWS